MRKCHFRPFYREKEERIEISSCLENRKLQDGYQGADNSEDYRQHVYSRRAVSFMYRA
jgi:hypothetical protein